MIIVDPFITPLSPESAFVSVSTLKMPSSITIIDAATVNCAGTSTFSTVSEFVSQTPLADSSSDDNGDSGEHAWALLSRKSLVRWMRENPF